MPRIKSHTRAGSTGRSNTRTRKSTRPRTTSRSTVAAKSYSPGQFRSLNNNIQHWIGSYRNIKGQLTGGTKITAFSPNGANKWCRYINSGNFVYKWTNADFCKKFGQQWSTTKASSAAFRWLKSHFGQGIKDVTRGKGGCWLVAATPNVSSGPFKNYKW